MNGSAGTAPSSATGGTSAGGSSSSASGATGGSAPSGSSSGGLDLVAPPDDAGTMTDDCADSARLVYVISDGDGAIYRFDPSLAKTAGQAAFTRLGVPQCKAKGAPNSMSVDRNGAAWINYASDGGIYKVDTTTLACEKTAFVSGGGIGFSAALSLGFSSDSSGSSSETLYISDNTGDARNTPGAGLGAARVDPTTLLATKLGPTAYSGILEGGRCELTGTGDARLFGFYTTEPAHLAEINKADGTTPNPIELPNVDAHTGGYAFSFWGGSFWFYTSANSDNSLVTEYDPSANTSEVVVPDVGFTIVGAGVSTCAPLVMPQPK